MPSHSDVRLLCVVYVATGGGRWWYCLAVVMVHGGDGWWE